MLKVALSLLLTALLGYPVSAQKYIDSIRRELNIAKDDSSKVNALVQLAGYHEFYEQDSNAYYVHEAIQLSEKIGYKRGILLARISEFFVHVLKADYLKALEIAQQNLQLAEALPYDRERDMAHVHNNLALVKRLMNDTLGATRESIIYDSLKTVWGHYDGDLWGGFKGIMKDRLGERDSAIYYSIKATIEVKTGPFRKIYSPLATASLADLYKKYGKLADARVKYDEALVQCDYFDNIYIKARIFRDLADYSVWANHLDSALFFGRIGMAICNKLKFLDYAMTTSGIMAGVFEREGKADSALRYFKMMQAARDSLFGPAKIQKFQLLITQNEEAQKEAVASKERLQSKVRFYSSLVAVVFFIIISFILYLNNRQKQKAYSIIRRQKQETEIQKSKVEQAYQDLKATQNQLVHAEKMASLGELTAGIAHEIQNPLNFVNNFSEVNTELIDEMKDQINQGNWEEVKAIADGIEENEKKIMHHGQRADGIVKSMLQHSRSGSSQKEPTDINAMADEYLRLAYHGFRAKEKDFNTQIETDFDPGLGKISLIPQDMGRVLLNAYNNAFYALHEKKKLNEGKFDPLISVSTKKKDNFLEVTVRDNGTGIPESIKEKIFQPFFTTKPAGQGTGLGLSLSYDIVTAHGGQVEMDSKDGEGSIFKFLIPMTQS